MLNEKHTINQKIILQSKDAKKIRLENISATTSNIKVNLNKQVIIHSQKA